MSAMRKTRPMRTITIDSTSQHASGEVTVHFTLEAVGTLEYVGEAQVQGEINLRRSGDKWAAADDALEACEPVLSLVLAGKTTFQAIERAAADKLRADHY